MSQNNLFVSEDYQYTTSNNIVTMQNMNVPQSKNFQTFIVELRDEIASLKTEILDLKKKVRDLKEGNMRSFIKLTKEVIAVKLEARKYHNVNIIADDFKEAQQFLLNLICDLNTFDALVQSNEEKLKHFKEFIAKTGAEGPAQFLRAAVRKLFSDDLASMYSWTGTNTKPSAEKCFVITTTKNICYHKYRSTGKDMNAVLQKHFVHVKDRDAKRKRAN